MIPRHNTRYHGNFNKKISYSKLLFQLYRFLVAFFAQNIEINYRYTSRLMLVKGSFSRMYWFTIS
jgi:hypothetical protein